MATTLELSAVEIDRLITGAPLRLNRGGLIGEAAVGIRGYDTAIEGHFAAETGDNLKVFCQGSGIAYPFSSFGVIVSFDRPTDINIHDDDHVLAPALRQLVERFGVVIFRNAAVPGQHREAGQRNIFPDRHFHIDRGPAQDNQISMF